MNRSPRRLLPLNPLRAFEAAARHLSFTQIAEELGVTQGAVSRHIRTLEDRLGFPLFVRTAQGLRLDLGGRVYPQVLHDALTRIARATDNLIATQTHSVLTIRGYTTFFIHWLIPRLPAFQRIHANIEVKLPLGQAHLATFELIPLAPLNPLRQLQGMTTGSPQDGR